MVADAKNMVLSINDSKARERWRASSRNLVDAVSSVSQAVAPSFSLKTNNAALLSQRNAENKKGPGSDEIPIVGMRQLYIQCMLYIFKCGHLLK